MVVAAAAFLFFFSGPESRGAMVRVAGTGTTMGAEMATATGMAMEGGRDQVYAP